MGRMSGWRSLWRFDLLAASILSSCFLLTEGQGTTTQFKIVLQPPRPVEGQSLTLTLTPEDALGKADSCRWFRGLTTEEKQRIFTYYFPPDPVQQNGPAFTGREMPGPGCSLQIRNLTSEDTGNYTVSLEGRGITPTIVSASVFVSDGGGGGGSGGLSGGAIAGIVIGTLVGVVLIAGLLYYICTKTSIGRMELHASNGNVPSAPGQNQGVTDTKPKAGEEDLQYSILAFKDTNRSPPRPTSEASQPSESGIIYSEIKKK